MPSVSRSAWIPRVLGATFLLFAVASLRELVYIPAHLGEFVLLGTVLTGDLAWTAAAVHGGYLVALAYGCLTKRRAAVGMVIAYCGYWIASVWVWAWNFQSQGNGTKALTSGLLTVLLLAGCRGIFVHREDFDR